MKSQFRLAALLGFPIASAWPQAPEKPSLAVSMQQNDPARFPPLREFIPSR
jgi:hypothetical protein